MDRSRDALRALFARGGLLLDGALGTELERRGLPTPPPLWSAAALDAAPEVVYAIHRDYVAAGAKILVANTFRTNPRTLWRAGRAADGPRLNRRAVELARRAADGHDVLVAASVAPVEDCYSPERVPAEATLRAEHAEFVDWLVAAEPDVLWIETIGTVAEARAAAEAAAPRAPFVVSFVVNEVGALLSGESLEEAITAVGPCDPLAIGLNCIPPAGVTALLPGLRRLTACPLLAYAHINNAVPIRGWSYSQTVTPAEYSEYVRQWLAQGVAVVGGCCGTTPEHIRAAHECVRRARPQPPR